MGIKRRLLYIFWGIFVITLLGVTFYTFRFYFSQSDGLVVEDEGHSYERHYVMIVDNPGSAFWEEVYQNASEEAEEENAYLELMGSDFSMDYEMEDYLEISISQKVDGIIVCPDGSEGVRDKIKEAVAADIPVVTVLNDESDIGRITYVGANSYELGQVYGEVISESVPDDCQWIRILQDEQTNSISSDIIFSQIKEIVNKEVPEATQITVESFSVSSENTFDTEEAIRDIFVTSDQMPDVLVCLSDVDSECACQAIVDYNKVGDVILIGYYTSEKVLDAIEKGIMSASVVINTDEMGKSAVQALEEYIGTGYSSDYISVDLNIVTTENVADYRQE